MKKKILLCSLVIVFLLLIVWLCCFSFSISRNKYNLVDSHSEIEQIFESDYDRLVQVAQYLNSLEDISHADIEYPNGTMTLRYGDKVEITNENALDTISHLFKKDYFKIKKENNTIVFYRWKNLFGRFEGFAFSTDGTGELEIQFLTEQKPLSKTNWYYYVSDYEEWRSN